VLDMLWVDVCAVVSTMMICSLNPVCGINAGQSGGQA